VLYAVSLGTTGAIRACPEVAPLAGLVLDAPVDDLLATAHRMLSEEPRPDRRRLGMWQPFRSLTILAVELWSGVKFSSVRPLDDVTRLDPAMPVLIIGGSEDLRVPPAAVQAMFDRVPASPDKKQLWIRQGSTHGQVWNDDPAGYREHLAAFLKLAAP
jgi:pimeloyl-ACP methyl ester carboxylesterase